MPSNFGLDVAHYVLLKKINKQKPQLNRVGRPEGGAVTLCNNSRAPTGRRKAFLQWQKLSQ